MSNVLIGIIGVILFIGLALAGALILGDDFTSASSSAQAAALMSQVKQAADAADMYRLKTGRQYVPTVGTSMMTPRFLKTPAVNPTSYARANPNAFQWTVNYNNNIYADAGETPTFAAKYVVAGVGPVSDARSGAVCLEIAQTYGATSIQTYGNGVDPPGPGTGCVIVEGNYVAYQRIAPSSQSGSTMM